MAKVIQVRNVPDEVHAELVAAADRAGESLNAYVLGVLNRLAAEIDPVAHDEQVLAKLRAEIGVVDAPRDVVLDTIDEGREERTQQLIGRYMREGA